MKIKLLNKNRGISLLEVMLSLAIIAVILVMATRYFGIASKESLVNQATQQISEIRQGYARWQTDRGAITGVTLAQLQTAGYITAQTATTPNPLPGGALTTDPAAGTMTVTVPNNAQCENLAGRFNTTCGGGTTFKVNLIP